MEVSLDNLKDNLNIEYDALIVSASYEDRCFSIYNSLKGHIDFKEKISSISTPHVKIINKNLDYFTSENFTLIEVNNSKQLDSFVNIHLKILNIISEKPNANFLVDITTFTRQTLLILLRVFRNLLTSNNSIKFVYTPAKEYAVGLPEEEKWLTKGIIEVNSVFGFSGIIRPSRPYHLIILMGYELERASSLINSYEPEKVSIGYARQSGSISDAHYNLNKKKFDDLLCEFPFAESFEFSCKDVIACKNDILQQANKYPDYNVVISPMNNKISTVSCALVGFDNEAIQLAIAIPAVYNFEKYSIPGDSAYILEIEEFIKH